MTQQPDHKTPVTLRQVAAAANVSVAAASQAMNGKGTLSEDTRARIRTVANELGFVPNRAAASLRSNRSMTIGFVTFDGYDADEQKRWANFYGAQLSALVHAAAPYGYTVTVLPNSRPELFALSDVDAIYFPEVFAGDRLIELAMVTGVILVTNDFVLEGARNISIDAGYARATTLALDHLRDAGARRIGLLTEATGSPGDSMGETTYLEWCADNGFEPVVKAADAGRTNYRAKVSSLLAEDVDAIFSYYEEGPEIFRQLTDSGLALPADLQFVALCLDDCQANEALGVTRVCVHPELAPAAIIETVVSANVRGPIEQRLVSLPVELAQGATTRS